ncbi:amino acid ABC transporter permease [Calditerricola satsumensis]|uniref:Amino acid ABC transporter permease n=1 Tax=Calditerricola satsumensis TaxID=373054 RepID=A0A8J3B595_9BACI|nr:amino acid ABC transporter permease [Calditerricola satsumensis]GGJ94621.1 amino acid ABC transporter permease [Calditerricola satsumensis]
MFDWSIIVAYAPLYAEGFFRAVSITAVSILIGTVLGMFLGMGRLSKRKWLRAPIVTYVNFMRGTPLLVQIFIIHFALIPTLFGQSLGVWVSGITALSLNSAAYIAEIFRAGIQSIDRGQMEAARSLGMRYSQAMRYVILPQAFKRMLPPLGNEAIMLLKDSSLLMVISFPELMYASKTVMGATSRAWEPYLTAAALYLVVTLLLARLVSKLEARYSNQ